MVVIIAALPLEPACLASRSWL